MLRLRSVALSFVLLTVLLAPRSHAQSATDQTAIRQLVTKYMAARNSADADATRSLFTPDADQLVSSGEWRRGIDALVAGAMASSKKEAGNSSITVEHVRALGPDIAIVDGRYQTSSAGGVRNMWTTLLAVRTPAGWRIAAIRNMLPSPR